MRALQTSKHEFDRTVLIDRLEDWIEIISAEGSAHKKCGSYS